MLHPVKKKRIPKKIIKMGKPSGKYDILKIQ